MKFGMIAGARNVVFFQYKMLVKSVKSNLGCALTVSWSDHSRIMLGSWSERSRIMVGSAAHCK